MLTENTCTLSISLALAIQSILHVSSANATVIVTPSSGSTPFAVSNSDLLQTALSGPPVTTGIFTDFLTGGETVLRDGSNGGASSNNYPTTALIQTGSTVTYGFNVEANPLGYILTEINTFGEWDEGRDAQNIDILYSTISNPTNFVALTTLAFDPAPGNFSRISVSSGSGDPFLATDVHSIRFSFGAQENSSGGYREFDVLGQAIPEPSAVLLLGASALAFVTLRKRSINK
jgi:hypothetical protein